MCLCVHSFVSQNAGWTSLHYAASKGNVDVLNVLIKKGANKEARTKEVRISRCLTTYSAI